ncbi:EamA family transporter [Granulicella sp. 5B5]|uniref:GRP family sugar transporter n=1 Tax=Granulicella sp. 5B5 TaxID=1617967 RepID=UPI0015F4EF99|nr:GRP family sugar transporter [Granulicella sp. 5B5]QMV18886.1 EamA family transporter [Granulicella sp. 5B5]
MATESPITSTPRKVATTGSLHALGVLCGLAAGVWLGAAEAPTKLVDAGLSPFAISLYMVAGVFAARWTFPTLLKGTTYVFADLFARKHLIVWAVLAGALWAVANTLTVFAIRDVGLATAFPLWNTNSLIGLLWARLLFRELKGAGPKNLLKVILGTVLIVIAAIMLGFSTIHGGSTTSPHAWRGLIAAAGASLMWGTMYVPYRKAYLSGMNPLSFVTAFTVGELGMMFLLTWTLDGGAHSSAFQLTRNQHLLFWLFLGGFIWVVGDLFQQFATKYLGIGRGIPLSNTNQLWGLAWGALVFGELATADHTHRALVLGGSILMILGALAISTAVASTREHLSRNEALERECERYGLEYREVLLAQSGDEFGTREQRRRWWDVLIVASATGLFIWLASKAFVPPLQMNLHWVAALCVVLLAALLGGGCALWRQTRFS